MKGIPVLMYHALEDAGHPAGAKDAGEQLYILQTEQFREQMAYLKQNGYRTCLLDELTVMETWPEKTVVLTFDDGHESNYTLALPILQQYGFKAHFFITTGWIGTPYFLTPEQIKALHEAGMGIGSHGVTHRFLSDLPDNEAVSELTESRERLSAIVGSSVTSFSAPGGRITSSLASSASKLGYSVICNSEPLMLNQKHLHSLLPRIAVRHSISIKEFTEILVKGIPSTNYIRYHLLRTAKTWLGNKRYEYVRSLLVHHKEMSK